MVKVSVAEVFFTY